MLDESLFEVTHALIRMSRMRVLPHAWASATGEYSLIFLRLVDNASIGSIVSGNYPADTFVPTGIHSTVARSSAVGRMRFVKERTTTSVGVSTRAICSGRTVFI